MDNAIRVRHLVFTLGIWSLHHANGINIDSVFFSIFKAAAVLSMMRVSGELLGLQVPVNTTEGTWQFQNSGELEIKVTSTQGIHLRRLEIRKSRIRIYVGDPDDLAFVEYYGNWEESNES